MAGYGDTSVDMMLNVLPGTFTGIFALNAGLSSINQTFQNMTKGIDNHFGLLDAALISATALTAQFAKGAADAYGEYEQGMKIVQAVSGQSSAAIAELGQKANEFSVQYRMDIADLTEGLQTLGRAGLKSATEQTEVLESGLQTAKLEGRDLNSVLEELIQNTTLLGGDLKSSNFGEQSEYVNDLLVATSMTAPINTHDVSETLKYSGGIAAAAGANIETDEGKEILEDYMGTIAAFAQKGVKGSIAGTALRAFFNKPATQDASVLEGLSMIGLKPEYLWEDDQETMKPVSEQISLIQSQMDKKGISQMDRLQIWSKIVGGKMGQQMMKLDGSDIRKITKDIEEANSAENLATQSMQTYQAAMKQTSEAGQLAFREFGEHVARFLTPVAKVLTPILQALSNPIVSTVAFGAFLKLISMAVNSIRKIFGGVRAELGILKAEFQSMILNQNNRKQLMGGHLWGKGSIDRYRLNISKASADTEIISNNIREASSVSNTSSTESLQKITQISARVEKIRSTLTAVNNRIKEVLLKIQSQIDKTISTSKGVIVKNLNDVKTSFDGGFSSSSKKIQTELTSSFTQSVNVLRNELNATISSTLTKFRTMSAYTGPIGGAAKGQFLAKNYSFLLSNAGTNSSIGNPIMTNGVVASTGTYSVDLQRLQKSYQTQANLVEREIAQIQNRQRFHSTIAFMEQKIETEDEAIIALKQDINTLLKQVKEKTGEEARLLTDKISLMTKELSKREEQVIMINNHMAALKTLYVKELEAIGRNITSRNLATTGTVVPVKVPIGQTTDNVRTNTTTGGSKFFVTKNSSTSSRNATNLLNDQIAWSQKDKAAREAILRERARNEKLLVQENVAKEETIRLEKAYNAKLAEALLAMEKNVLGKSAINPYTLSGYNRYNLPNMNGVVPTYSSPVTSGSAHAAGMAAFYSMYPRFFHEGENVALSLSGKSTTIPMNETVQKINQTLIAFDKAVAKTTARIDSRRAGFVTTQGSRTVIGSGFNEESYAKAEAKQAAANLERSLKESEAKINSMTGKNIRTIAMNPIYSVGPKLPADSVMEENKNLMKEAEMTAEKQRQINAAFGTSSNIDKVKGRLDKVKGRWDQLTGLGKASGSASKSLSRLSRAGQGLSNAFSKGINAVGGKFFAALIAIDVAMQIYTTAHNNYIKKIEEATQKIDEMQQAVSDAENVFFNGKNEEGEAKITGWSEEHPDATAEEKEDALLGAYADIYDHSAEGLSSLDANTQQLAIATEELKRANKRLENSFMDGSFFAADGFTSKAEANQIASGNIDFMESLFGSRSEFYGKSDFSATKYVGKDFFDTGDVVLSENQKKEEYPYSTELAPALAYQIWQTEDFKKGFRGALGNAGYEKLTDYLSSFRDPTFGNSSSRNRVGTPDPFETSAFGIHGSNLQNYFRSNSDQNRLQMALKNFSKDFSKLAKQTRRFEKATGRTALGSLQNEMKKTKNMKQALKNLQVTDPKLVNYIKSLAIKTGMDEQQILMAAQLQQLQEMHEIGQNQVAPRMEHLVNTAYQQVAYGGQTLAQVGGSGSGAVGAAQNAAAIANILGVMMEQKLDEKSYQEYLDTFYRNNPSGTPRYQTAEEFAAASKGAYSRGENNWLSGYYERKQQAYAATNYLLYNPDMSSDVAAQRAADWWKGVSESGASVGAIQDTLRKGAQTALATQVLDAYDAGLDQEEGDGGSGGGGGGSGSGSGDKDKNTGTRRERVDLVLCSKKEIPKLNVNLFKKPPSFTILNKNFKLRDVKINSEDKPKAIMAAIKNSFIDIQKRTDPKIIQDEDAVYDPKAATDGTNVPSGSAKTKTDNNNS